MFEMFQILNVIFTIEIAIYRAIIIIIYLNVIFSFFLKNVQYISLLKEV